MKRRLLAISIALLVIGPIAVAGVLLHTETALRWVLAAVQQQSGGTLHIATATGTLSGPITLHDVTLKNAAFTLRIERLDVEWHPLALLVNRLDLRKVQAQHLSLNLVAARGTGHGHFAWPTPPRLPFTVVIRELHADDMQLAGPPLPQPIRLTRLDAGVRLDNRAWQVSRLTLNGEQVQARGHANWQFSRDETLDAALHWDLNLPGQPQLAGDAQLQGNAQLLKLGMTLTAPAQLRLDADIRTLSDTPSWQGTLRLQHAHAGRYLAALRDTTLQGTARFSGTPAATSLNGSVQAQAGADGDWRGQFALRYTPAQLEVQQLELARAASDTRFRLHGR
ncbi:MAG TPA: hypothetical protein VFM15_02710, partial [Gammaproteobacteria bacterium]|nr:hypothetical protein [Gammaproteobacteria bacterium]